MNKERLIELLHLVAMGRRDAVQELADLLCPGVKPVEKAKSK